VVQTVDRSTVRKRIADGGGIVFGMAFDRKAWMKVYLRRYREENRERLNEKKREYAAKIRAEGIAEYGGFCSCCGETIDEFLTIEHTDGSRRRNGDLHRGGGKLTGQSMWMKLRSLGWPKKGYTIMCLNCNHARGTYGECPHQRREGR